MPVNISVNLKISVNLVSHKSNTSKNNLILHKFNTRKDFGHKKQDARFVDSAPGSGWASVRGPFREYNKAFRHVENVFIQGFLFIHPRFVFIVQAR